MQRTHSNKYFDSQPPGILRALGDVIMPVLNRCVQTLVPEHQPVAHRRGTLVEVQTWNNLPGGFGPISLCSWYRTQVFRGQFSSELSTRTLLPMDHTQAVEYLTENYDLRPVDDPRTT